MQAAQLTIAAAKQNDYLREGVRTRKLKENCDTQYNFRAKQAKSRGAGGTDFIVIRHFTGDREIGKIAAEAARERADREAGLHR